MIYGKIWCVVKPSVGVPIIIGAAAVASFAVHVALTVNTTWVKTYLNGSAARVTAEATHTAPPLAALSVQDTKK